MKNVTNIDTMDRETFHEASANIAKVEEIREAVKTTDPELSGAFDDLLEDGFGLMYKYAPKVEEHVPVDRKVNKRVADTLTDLSEYDRLRKFTRGDATNASLSLDMLKRVFDELPEDVKNQQKCAQTAQQSLEDIFANGDPQGTDCDEFASALDAVKQADTELEKVLDANEDEIRQAIRGAVDQATETASECASAMGVLGYGTEAGEITNSMSTEARAKLASLIQNSPRLQEVVKLAGRMKQIALKKQAEKADYERQELQGVEFGNDLMKLTPSERMLLANGDDGMLEGLFFKKYMNRALMQYKITGKDTKARGPIVVPVDCSGSMRGVPDTWSKALALAMYMIARKQKRDFCFFLFNTKVVKTVVIKKNENDALGLTEILSHGTGGGTSFECPLDESIKAIEESKEFEKADIVFITDGDCRASADWLTKFNKWRKDKGVDVCTLFVNTWGGSSAQIEKFSNRVVNLAGDLITHENAAFDVAFTI